MKDRKSKTDVGTLWKNRSGDTFEVLEKLPGKLRKVRFLNIPNYETVVTDTAVQANSVGDPYSPKLCGVGFIGTGIYGSKTHVLEYRIWSDMIRRCYSSKAQEQSNPTYRGCSVNLVWQCFQNFAFWCNTQTGFGKKDFNLDKDIISHGNREYSPLLCRFVPNEINVAFSTNTKYNIEKKLPTGITISKGGKYVVQISTFGRNKEVLRTFNLDEAIGVYKQVREDYIKVLADKWKTEISLDVYEALMSFKESDRRGRNG